MLTYYITILIAVSAAALAQGKSADDESHGKHSMSNPWFALAVAAVLTSVAAFRWRVGVDYDTYVSLYRTRYTTAPLRELKFWDEPGIVVIAKVAERINGDYATMFALASLITVGLSVWTFYRTSPKFGYAILLYIISTTWQSSFNGVRQFLACSILFAGHQLILERKFFRYLLVVLFASLFHISAVVAILLYWVPRRRMGFFLGVALIVTAAVSVSLYDALGQVFNWTKQEDVTAGAYFVEEVNPLRTAAAFAPLVVYLLFTDKTQLKSREFFWVNMAFINGAILLAASGSAYIARFSVYTMVYLALAIPAIWRIRDGALRALVIVATLAGHTAFWYLETVQTSALNSFQWVFER